jgi:DNA polymerase III subunit epsilon
MPDILTSRCFAAIDFETATKESDSACAVAIVRVEDGRVVDTAQTLLRPPRQDFIFTDLHGISWEMVKDAPTFGEAWPKLRPVTEGVDFLAAHYAPFDRAVLYACMHAAGIEPPETPFECTVVLARQTWGIYPTKLNLVCRRLGIELDNHHDALCDAMACARIVIAAQELRRNAAAAGPR